MRAREIEPVKSNSSIQVYLSFLMQPAMAPYRKTKHFSDGSELALKR